MMSADYFSPTLYASPDPDTAQIALHNAFVVSLSFMLYSICPANKSRSNLQLMILSPGPLRIKSV